MGIPFGPRYFFSRACNNNQSIGYEETEQKTKQAQMIKII